MQILLILLNQNCVSNSCDHNATDLRLLTKISVGFIEIEAKMRSKETQINRDVKTYS
jgi:glutaredoxin